MIRRAMAAFAGALIGATAPAAGQEQESAPTPSSPGDTAAEVTEEIVVTGSRVKRKDLTTPAPVVVITRDDIARTGFVSVGEFLQALPEQANGTNRNWNYPGDGSTRVNMRGLGEHRTLVLLNGRRLVAGGLGADSSTDLSGIPSAVIERIEVLKDGASPMYGSDALGGVVNLITRRSFSGAEATTYTGVSSRGDGATFSGSLTTGRATDEGSLLFSAGYTGQNEIWSGRRPWGQSYFNYDFTGTNSPLGQVGPFAVGSNAIPAGRVVLPKGQSGTQLYQDLLAQYPDALGFVPDPSASLGWRPYRGSALPGYGGDGWNTQPDNYLVTPSQVATLFSTGEARLSGASRAFFETAYSTRQSQQKAAPEPFSSLGDGIVVSAQNQYNPFGVDLPRVSRRLVEAGNRTFTQSVEALRILGGLDGSVPASLGPFGGWTWELSVGQGRSRATQVKSGYTRISALRDALGPSFQDAQGWHCGTAATGPIPGCVPLNLFGGPGSITPDQVAALTFDGASHGTNVTSTAQATLSGSLFSLFAERPIGIALGYEYRSLSGTMVPDPVTAGGDASTDGAFARTSGSQDAHEAYAELSVPILSGVRLAESVEALAAARVFRYSGFGTDWSWKLGGRWTPVRDLTLRGTVSTAYRAPSILELHQGAMTDVAGVVDPCAGVDQQGSPKPVSPWCGPAANNGNSAPVLTYVNQGNPALRPELARVVTAGFVVEPRSLKNFSLTLDLYDIRMRNAIRSFGTFLVGACYPMSAAIRPSFCEHVQRDPVTQELTGLLDTPLNAGTERMTGVDVAMRYALPTPVGRFGLTLDLTWLDRYDLTMADGTVLHARSTFDFPFTLSWLYPEWKYNAGATWGWRNFAAGVAFRYMGGFKECTDAAGALPGSYPDSFCSLGAPFVHYVRPSQLWDTFASYAFQSRAGKTSISVGVQNLFDRAPPTAYASWYLSDPSYDFVGRFIYARLSHRL